MVLIRRNIFEVAEETIDAFPAVVIQGARQVGKSTLAGQLASGRNGWNLTLDDEQTLAAAREDPIGFVNQRSAGILVIDEIQRYPELTLAIKASIDRDRRNGRFLLTGSSDLLRSRRATDSLAGRAATVWLRTLSRGEFAGKKEDFIRRFREGIPYRDVTSQVSRADYARMIVVGGYPDVRDLEPRMRNVWFDSYLERLIRRDARELINTDPSRLMSLLRLMAANQAGELVKARLAQDAGLPATSITAYLDTLETLFLTDLLKPWKTNLTGRETSRPKASIADSGLAARLSRVTTAQLTPLDGTATHFGALMEGFVADELLKQSGWSEEEFELFHYRNRDGLEVDVIVEFADGQVLGIEVKSGSTFRSDHFRPLKTLRDLLGDRFAGGVVLNTGATGYQFGDRLFGLPVSSLWEL
ncbi:ATP-binding protein [Rathayibacter soli]|uniref:ATP-binding protein n=1 Tax=Rathayibacter soli TaxID=3144168 RepID=UPI0027E5241B|nr:ATP-binding protein [Glaciibacter superstes]